MQNNTSGGETPRCSTVLANTVLVIAVSCCFSACSGNGKGDEVTGVDIQRKWSPSVNSLELAGVQDLPEHFIGGGTGRTILLDIHLNGQYEYAENSSLGRLGGGHGAWGPTSRQFVYEGEYLSDLDWLGAIAFEPVATTGVMSEQLDLAGIAKDISGQWQVVLASGDVLRVNTPGRYWKESIWNSPGIRGDTVGEGMDW